MGKVREKQPGISGQFLLFPLCQQRGVSVNFLRRERGEGGSNL